MELLNTVKSFLITTVYASGQVPSDAPVVQFSISTVNSLVIMITNIIIVVGIAVVLVMLALGFLKYVTSQGDKAAVESAQKTLTYAVIGGVGLLLVFSIRAILASLLGASGLTSTNY